MQDGSLGRGEYFTSIWSEATKYAMEKQEVEDIEDLDESKILEVFLNVRDDNNITHSRYYREDIEVLATNSKQIKSATDNIGTFDSNNPDIRFRSATHIGNFVVLTEIQHGGRNFVVAIEANRRQGRIEVNSIRSVYPKNNKQVANWIEDGLLEYAHKERMSEWFSKQQSNSADVRKLFRDSTKF